MNLTASNFKTFFVKTAKSSIYRWHQFWHLASLLLFEPEICRLCQIDLPLSIERKKVSPLQKSQWQNVRERAIFERAALMLNFAEKNLCPACISFFTQLTSVKTTLISDDDCANIDCFSSGFYAGPLQEAVYQIKYLKRPELAHALAFCMLPPAISLLNSLKNDEKPIILPIPLHWTKMKERGFNQAEALAANVAQLLDLKVDSQNLKRVRQTRPQFGLSRAERSQNLKGAFAATKKLESKKVILVDDVLTSGATLYECALAVDRAGGTVVGAITLARAKWQKSQSSINTGLSDYSCQSLDTLYHS